jgi:hypothetical protein
MFERLNFQCDMKNAVVFLTVLLFCSSIHGQWKAQTGETYENKFRMAYVTSLSGSETLRVLRNIPEGARQKTADPYEQVTGQILLNKNIGNDNRVQSLVFRFDNSPKIYVNQPSDFKQGWDANARKYMIESDWKLWRLDDVRNKESRRISSNPDSIPPDKQVHAKEIIQLLKASGKVNCQIVLINKVYGTQSMISSEFSLKNSSKSINYLFQ